MIDENPRAYPDRPYVGVGVVVFRGDEVLLAQRGKKPSQHHWSIPGGAQELGETVEEAAHREIKEETGLEISLIGLVEVVNSINRDDEDRVQFHYTLVDFVAEWKSGDIVAGDDATDARWVPINQIGDYGLRPLTHDVILQADTLRKSENKRAQKTL
ncbi:MAG: phosphohydrolase [Rhodospirillaceae bacterium]|nr:phosphohydrolase [Rhodospirillaceae bacterium]|tara:strand:- start:6566 stop:7036 length:471 start_codon:yes stop_codon:yes gene_type:complete